MIDEIKTLVFVLLGFFGFTFSLNLSFFVIANNACTFVFTAYSLHLTVPFKVSWLNNNFINHLCHYREMVSTGSILRLLQPCWTALCINFHITGAVISYMVKMCEHFYFCPTLICIPCLICLIGLWRRMEEVMTEWGRLKLGKNISSCPTLKRYVPWYHNPFSLRQPNAIYL